VDHIVLGDAPARPATSPSLWLDHGPDFYAAVTWSDIRKSDGRRIALGWMSNWQYAADVPTSPWRSAMSLPRVLRLEAAPEGLRLRQEPIRELQKLRTRRQRLRSASLAEANSWLETRSISGRLLEMMIEFENVTDQVGLSLTGGSREQVRIACDIKRDVLELDRTQAGRSDFHQAFPGTYSAPLRARNGRVNLHVWLDTSSVEVFANEGATAMTALFFPENTSLGIRLIGGGDAAARVRRLTIWELATTWK
jgi:sucrose-6-phosphate hydrolase SacC (GH32 family)